MNDHLQRMSKRAAAAVSRTIDDFPEILRRAEPDKAAEVAGRVLIAALAHISAQPEEQEDPAAAIKAIMEAAYAAAEIADPPASQPDDYRPPWQTDQPTDPS